MDLTAIDKELDYIVPAALAHAVEVGTRVRIRVQGRAAGGWIVADPVAPTAGVSPLLISSVTGMGPPPAVVSLARWASKRWAGRMSSFMTTASPPRATRPVGTRPASARPGGLPRSDRLPRSTDPPSSSMDELVTDALGGEQVVLRLAPASDRISFVVKACRRLGPGSPIVLVPTQAEARSLADSLAESGLRVALYPNDWERAAAGNSVIVGARSAAWAPVGDLTGAIVLDAHDEAYQEQRAPTWIAPMVLGERAQRQRAPSVLVSACPTLEMLASGRLITMSRREERLGWPVVEVVDRRRDDPRLGLLGTRVTALLRDVSPDRQVVCVLNRKGRARLLACSSCRDLVRCERCGGPMAQSSTTHIHCRSCHEERVAVCTTCGSQRLAVLRSGVTRVAEDIRALTRHAVAEVTGDGTSDVTGEGRAGIADAAVVVGTEAVLHRMERADCVVFLDFDQEMFATRYSARETALALLCRAARLVGGRREATGRVVVQTRVVRHPVLEAAVRADPGILASSEAEVRQALQLPPEVAMARISGPGAQGYVDHLSRELQGDLDAPGEARKLLVHGRSDGSWLVKAPDHRVLCGALVRLQRSARGVRVEVDPKGI